MKLQMMWGAFGRVGVVVRVVRTAMILLKTNRENNCRGTREAWRGKLKALMAVVSFLFCLAPASSMAHPVAYGSGEVVSAPRVVVVYWGFQNFGFVPAMNRFYSQILGSSYFDWLSDYSTPQQSIGRGTFAGSFAIRSSDSGPVGTIRIAREIDAQIISGTIPAPTADTIYMIHFGPTMNPAIGTSIGGIVLGPSTGSFCGYHFAARTQVPVAPPLLYAYGPKIRIAVVPTVFGVASCTTGGGLVDDATSIASHELMEAITDPDPAILNMFPVIGETITCNGWSLLEGVPVANTWWAWFNAGLSFPCVPHEIADDFAFGRPILGRFITSSASTDSFLVSFGFRNAAGANVLSGPAGNLDGVNINNDGVVRGWALDQMTFGPILVSIVIDGGSPFTVTANLSRPDVNTVTGVPGAHGFSFSIPSQFLDGLSHSIVVTARGAVPGNDTRLSQPAQTFRSPLSARQICLADCKADRDACLQDATTISQRGICARQYNICTSLCP